MQVNEIVEIVLLKHLMNPVPFNLLISGRVGLGSKVAGVNEYLKYLILTNDQEV